MASLSSSSSNWSELPSHLQALCMNKLVSIKDYIRFGAVCSSWHSVFTHYLDLKKLPPQLPLLMIHEDLETIKTRKFYCLSGRRLCDLEIKLPHCRGSKHGWLVMMEGSNLPVRLYNPFLSVNNEIELPPLSTLDMKRAFPSKNPTTNPNDYVVIGIVGGQGRVAFCKPGDKAWSFLPSPWLNFDDVTYYNGLFYAVGYLGEVIAIDLTVTDDSTQQHPVTPKVKRVAIRPPSELKGCIGIYIVESSGYLLQVQRFHNKKLSDNHIVTNMFRVFKLLFNPNKEEQDDHEQNGKDFKWLEVKTLDGKALFLGNNASISLSASDFPECKPNCIYFTDESLSYIRSDGPYDTGVFNLEDGNTEQLIYPRPNTLVSWVPHIWVEPSLQR